MMKVWMIWVQGDTTTLLEAAWEDDMTAENRSGYDAEIDRIEKMCHDNPGYTMRVQAILVPGVPELFDIPTVEAQPA